MQGVFIRSLKLPFKISTISIKALLSISNADYGADVRVERVLKNVWECFIFAKSIYLVSPKCANSL